MLGEYQKLTRESIHHIAIIHSYFSEITHKNRNFYHTTDETGPSAVRSHPGPIWSHTRHRTQTDNPRSTFTQQTGEDHHEAGAQVDVNRLDVRYLGQGSVRRRHQSGHRQHGGDAEGHPGRSCVPVKPERHPRYDDDQPGRDVDLDQVVSHRSDELDLTRQTRVVSCGGGATATTNHT